MNSQLATAPVGPLPAPTRPSSGAKSILSSMAKKPASKSGKSDKPVLQDPLLADSIAAYITHKTAMDTAKALMEVAADQLLSAGRQARLGFCIAAGKVIASIGINNRLTLTQTCKYCVVPEERADDLQAAFGERYEKFFKPTLSIALKAESANNEDVLAALVDAVGAEFIEANFDVRRDVVVQEAYHIAYSTDENVQAIAQPFMDDQVIRPYTASLKIT